MGLSVSCSNLGQFDKLRTRAALPGKRVATIIMFLVIMFFGEVSDAISDFGGDSLTIQSNEEFFKSKPKVEVGRRRKVRFTVRLHLPDVKMSQHLNDRTSPQYTTLSRSLSKDIHRLFANTVGKQRVSNIRFAKFKGHHQEHESLNEASSVQKETPLSTHSPSPKPLLLLSSTPASSSASTKKPKKRGRTAFPFPRPTTAAVTSSKGAVQLPLNETHIAPSKLLSTTTSFINVVTTATTTLNPTTMAATSSQTTATTRATKNASEKVFSIALTTRMFKECYARSANGDYIILMEKYLDAYSELMGIFNFFGPVFSFAGDDVKDKLAKLRDLRKQDIKQSQNNYATFQSMFEYEYSPQGSQAEQGGVSTNSWLHRALKFISALIKASLDTSSGKTLGDHARELYADIMAPYHPWYVRTVAYLALLTFPTRVHLMEQMGITESADDMQGLSDLSSAINAVYEDIENLYVKYSS